MKNTIAASFLAALLVVPAIASADDQQGRVTDVNSWSVTLDSGILYTVNDTKVLEGIQAGDEVKVTYSENPEHAPMAGKVQKISK